MTRPSEEIVRFSKEKFIKNIKELNKSFTHVSFSVEIVGSQIIVYSTKDGKRTFLMMANGYVQAYRKLSDLMVLISVLHTTNKLLRNKYDMDI